MPQERRPAAQSYQEQQDDGPRQPAPGLAAAHGQWDCFRQHIGPALVGRGQVLQQDIAQLLGGLKALARVLGQQARDNLGKRARRLAIHLMQRRRHVIGHLAGDRQRVIALERRMARAHGIHHATKAKQVAARVHPAAGDLLRRHVRRRSYRTVGRRDLRGVQRHERQPKVGYFHALDAVFKQDVGRLDVAVNHPVLMRRRQAGGDLGADPQHGRQIERRPEANAITEGAAGHILHNQVGHALLFVHSVNRHDIGMIDPGRGASLA